MRWILRSGLPQLGVLALFPQVVLAPTLMAVKALPGDQLSPLQDRVVSSAVYLEAAICVLLSLWGSADLRRYLEANALSQEGGRRSLAWGWILGGAITCCAISLIIGAQGTVRFLQSLLDATRTRGEPWFVTYDALQTCVLTWAIVLAYKLKIVWDVIAQAVGPKR